MCETTTTIIKEWKWRCASSASVRQSAASAAHNSTLIDRAPFPLSLLTHSFAHYYFYYCCCCLNLPAIAVATTATVQMHLSVSTVRQLGISSSRSRSVDQQRGQSTAAKSAKWQLPHKCCQEKLKRSSSSLMCSEKWERRRCAPRKERKRKKKKKKITTNFQSPKLLSATEHTSLQLWSLAEKWRIKIFIIALDWPVSVVVKTMFKREMCEQLLKSAQSSSVLTTTARQLIPIWRFNWSQTGWLGNGN